MNIILSPQASNKTTSISLDGLIITIDDVQYDLSEIPLGGQAESDLPFLGTVMRDEVTILYEYDSSLAVDDQSPDVSEYTFNITTGEVPSPIEWRA
tara:strand:- start:125 stop:412 length:288 start_codon:yes stop_codon:yes gene_type:complete